MNRIKLSLTICLAILISAFVSCSSDSDDIQNNGTEENGRKESGSGSKLDVLFLRNASQQGGTVPRLLAFTDEWGFAELTENDASDMHLFLFVNQAKQEAYTLVVNDKVALVCPCSTASLLPENQILMYCRTEDGMRVALCDAYWESGTYAIKTETMVTNDVNHSAKARDMDFARERVSKMLDDIKTSTDKIGWVANILELPGVDKITDVWGKVVIPYAKYSLWEDDPQKLEEIREEYIQDTGEGIILDLLPVKEVKRMWYTFKLMGGFGAAKEYSGNIWNLVGPGNSDDNIPQVSEEGKEKVRSITQIAQSAEPIHGNFMDLSRDAKYWLAINVVSVAETEATFSGAFDMQDDYGSAGNVISEMGFVVREKGNPSTERTISSWQLREITVGNLKSGTEYEVWAFVGSLFGTRTSVIKTFTTEGRFEISPTELVFEPEGGTKSVTVAVGKGMTWHVSDKPQWCSVKENQNGFAVSVGTTKESRMGTITVTATRNNGSTVSSKVAVTQRTNMYICPDNNHPHAINLGLPSGTIWACCNDGASYPEGYGTRYDPKLAQRRNWGGGWRLPTADECSELGNCPSTWTQFNGIYGRIFFGYNGNSVFLPVTDPSENRAWYMSSTWGTGIFAAVVYNLYFEELGVRPRNGGWSSENDNPVRLVKK